MFIIPEPPMNIDMKLGPITKIDKKNKTSKN